LFSPREVRSVCCFLGFSPNTALFSGPTSIIWPLTTETLCLASCSTNRRAWPWYGLFFFCGYVCLCFSSSFFVIFGVLCFRDFSVLQHFSPPPPTKFTFFKFLLRCVFEDRAYPPTFFPVETRSPLTVDLPLDSVPFLWFDLSRPPPSAFFLSFSFIIYCKVPSPLTSHPTPFLQFP